MDFEESVEQLENLIESWQLNEADLNQTDIDAMKIILKENQELKKQLEEYKNSQSCSFVNICKSTKIANYYQQKEFIKYLEDEIERLPKSTTWFYRNDKGKLIGHTEIVQGAYKEILQKYKRIIGDDKK